MKPLSFLLGAAVGWLLVRRLRRVQTTASKPTGAVYWGKVAERFNAATAEAYVYADAWRVPDDVTWAEWRGYVN